MKYQQFQIKKDIDLRLLSLLDILRHEHRIIELNLYPDYDLSAYDKFVDKEYFFYSDWNFAEHYSAILNFYVNESRTFMFDDIVKLSSKYNIKYSEEESWDIILNRVRQLYSDLFSDEGIEPDFNGFKLGVVKNEPVDQFRKSIKLFGSYIGGSDSIDPVDWRTFVECSFYGFVSGSRTNKFYVDLIAESYALQDAKNYKLAYFMAFTALENYINECQNINNGSGRLKDKLSDIFKMQFNCLGKHEIYTSLLGEFKKWEALRNHIAHGKKESKVSEKDVTDLLVFILTLLSSLEKRVKTFEELFEQLPTIK